MTVASTLNRVSYTGNSVTTAFAVSFPFQSATDLVVVETVIATGVQTTKTITTHYTVSGTPDSLGYYPNGGTVTAVTAPPATVTWTIYRDPAALQSLNLSESNALPAESLEAQLDYLTMLVQRLKDRVDRSLRQPDGDSAAIGILPSKVDRASKYHAYNAAGDPIATVGTTEANPVSTFMATVLDDTTAAAARATLGAAGSSANETISGTKIFDGDVSLLNVSTLNLSGAGIGFPSTQVPSFGANVLDDYEEGTWTPSVGGTATYTERAGEYIKIGRMVHITCRITINAIGTGSREVISGLPFSSSATAYYATGAVEFSSSATNVTHVVARVSSAASTIVLVSTTAAAASHGTSPIFANGTTVSFALTYMAAS